MLKKNSQSRLFYGILIGIILISIFSIYLVSAPESKPEITNTLITTDVSKGIFFDINKSGIEEYLDIDYKELNENTTRFCVKFNNQSKYTAGLPKNIKVSSIPITKLINGSAFNFDKTTIDLTGVNCFNVTYSNIGFQFKVGINSILVTATFDTDATEGVGKNIYRDIWGNLNVAYTSAGNDFGFARSTDNGTTWSASEIATGTFDDFGITGNSTGGLFVYYSAGNDIDGYFSTNNGTTWTAVASLMDNTRGFIEPSCDIDSNNIYHCCAEDTSNEVWYTNSSSWNTLIDVYQGNAGGASRCFLSINQNNTIYILIADNYDDNLTFEIKTTSDANFWANPVYKGSGNDFPGPTSVSMSVSSTQDVYGNDVLIAFGNATNTVACTYPLYCNSIPNSYFATSSVAWNSKYQAIVLTGNSSVAGGYSYKSISNSIPATYPAVPSWTTSSLNSKSDFPSVANQIFPARARLNDWAYIVYTNATGLFFLAINMTLPVVASTCSYTSGNYAVNCADYCNFSTNINGGGTNNFTTSGSGRIVLQANISGFKNYRISRGCTATCTSTGCIRI